VLYYFNSFIHCPIRHKNPEKFVFLQALNRQSHHPDNHDVLRQSHGSDQPDRVCCSLYNRLPGEWGRPEASPPSVWSTSQEIGIPVWIHLTNDLRGMLSFFMAGTTIENSWLMWLSAAGLSSHSITIGHWYEALWCGSAAYRVLRWRDSDSIAASWDN
jgi:hypothetical protein